MSLKNLYGARIFNLGLWVGVVGCGVCGVYDIGRDLCSSREDMREIEIKEYESFQLLRDRGADEEVLKMHFPKKYEEFSSWNTTRPA